MTLTIAGIWIAGEGVFKFVELEDGFYFGDLTHYPNLEHVELIKGNETKRVVSAGGIGLNSNKEGEREAFLVDGWSEGLKIGSDKSVVDRINEELASIKNLATICS